jgi:hypothetical protein
MREQMNATRLLPFLLPSETIHLFIIFSAKRSALRFWRRFPCLVQWVQTPRQFATGLDCIQRIFTSLRPTVLTKASRSWGVDIDHARGSNVARFGGQPEWSAPAGQPTETGDAWLIEPSDQLAAQLARDGDPEPFHIEDNETTFTIDWKGRYRIEGDAFVYMDRETGRLATIHGYPTHKLVQKGWRWKFQISLARLHSLG